MGKSVSVKEVQALNGKIDELNTKRTKVETQTEMLRGQLSTELKSYKESFGVNLEGVTLNQTRKLIANEVKKVLEEVSAEYELKEKVIELIEQGDIEAANKLLGVEVAPVEEPVEEVVEGTSESVVEEPISVEEDNFTIEDMAVVEDDIELPVTSGTKVASESKQAKEVVEKKAPAGMSGFADAMGTVEDEDSNITLPGIGDLQVEDEDDDPFGFGDLLEGTSKF